MEQKRKRGRLPKPPGERQTERFVVRVTPAEAKLLVADVTEAEATTGAFLVELWRQWRSGRENHHGSIQKKTRRKSR